MPIISIDSALFCGGSDIVGHLVQNLGYPHMSEHEIFSFAEKQCQISSDKLKRVVYGPSSILESKTKKAELIAHLRLAMASLLEKDCRIFHGFCGHLIPKSIEHVLKVCLAGTFSFRMDCALNQGLKKRDAEKKIKNDDKVHSTWTQYLFDKDPWDKSLYDLFIPVSKMSSDDLLSLIKKMIGSHAVATTPKGLASIKNFQLASQVQLALAKNGYDADVESEENNVTILIKERTLFLDRLIHQLIEIANKVPGVRSAIAKPGPRYPEAHIGFNMDVKIPTKVLLVDDEKEFIQTLSERLQTREIDSSIAYDGEEALNKVDGEKPDVMLLDLKMPGIDGLEVLRRIKIDHPNTEVIILTGHGSESEEKLAYQLGAFAYLRKPVDINILTEKMKAAYLSVSHKQKPNNPLTD